MLNSVILFRCLIPHTDTLSIILLLSIRRTSCPCAGKSRDVMATDASSEKSITLRGVTASAGAKVMITGGYLVLERPNTGLIICVDARLRSSVFGLPVPANASETANTEASDTLTIPIFVQTPQRSKLPLSFSLEIVRKNIDDKCVLETTLGGSGVTRNSFVAITLRHSLSLLSAVLSSEAFIGRLGAGLLIRIRGDRAYYSSQPVASKTVPACCTSSPLSSCGSVNGVDCAIENESSEEQDDPADYQTKTGLGSSAAVVSSLVAALFAFFGLPVSPVSSASSSTTSSSSPSSEEKDGANVDYTMNVSAARTLAYRLAQFAHCAAQGKVGSGFDVAAAFYGTQTYSRFAPAAIEDLLAAADETTLTTDPTTSKALLSGHSLLARLGVNPCAEKAWAHEMHAFTLPAGLRILLGDVQGGSETPGMVKKILHWYANVEGAKAVWEQQGRNNKAVEALYAEIAKLGVTASASYTAALRLAVQHDLASCDAATNPLFKQAVSEAVAAVISESAGAESLQSVEAVTRDTLDALATLRAVQVAFERVRAGLRAMGTGADVPVEPAEQTALLNATQALPGVLMAGVPGAGGYDAVFAVVAEDGSGKAVEGVKQFWAQWKGPAASSTSSESTSTSSSGGSGSSVSGIPVLPVDIDRMDGVESRPVCRVVTADTLQCLAKLSE